MIANRKIDQAWIRLIKWSEKPQWVDFLNHIYSNHLDFAFYELELMEEELFDYLDPETGDSIHHAIFEDFFTTFFGVDGELNVINDYLKRRGSREPAVVRQFLKALLDSSVSIFEIVELEPNGRTMKVRDLLQEDMTLTIQKSSELDHWVIWDCMGARVVSMSGKHYITNGARLLSRSLAKEIVVSVNSITREKERDIIRRMRFISQNSAAIPSISREILCAVIPMSSMITHAWLEELVAIAEAPLPTLHNTDDEEIMICEVQFPILGDLTDLIATLDGFDDFEDFERSEEETSWRWLEPGGPTDRLARRQKDSSESKEISGPSEFGMDSTVIGYIRIRSKSLVLTVNSVERADRGKMLLESRLGNLVGNSLTSYQELEQAMLERPDSPAEERPIMNEEVSEIQGDYLKEHYGRVLDGPVPMLGNKIPRKAVKTKKGRSEVVEWLKTMENLECRRSQIVGSEPFDMTWIWGELKIDALRR